MKKSYAFTVEPKEYSVWVGGSEVNDYSLPLDKALLIASQWQDNGYDDVEVVAV